MCIESVEDADICEGCGAVEKYEEFVRDEEGVALCHLCAEGAT